MLSQNAHLICPEAAQPLHSDQLVHEAGGMQRRHTVLCHHVDLSTVVDEQLWEEQARQRRQGGQVSVKVHI